MDEVHGSLISTLFSFLGIFSFLVLSLSLSLSLLLFLVGGLERTVHGLGGGNTCCLSWLPPGSRAGWGRIWTGVFHGGTFCSCFAQTQLLFLGPFFIPTLMCPNKEGRPYLSTGHLG